ncbi:MAG TPA: hypothetical protein VMM81_06870 [Acidimicrobiia bacterium]|nr:hypothetical protein [Acidimicrobiia bacterium]
MPKDGQMSFMERRRFDVRNREFVTEESLRERFPTYLKVFALGLVFVLVVAGIVTIFGTAGFDTAFGYSAIFFGTLLLLLGGARGGGYSNLGVGAVEALVGGRNRVDEDPQTDAATRRGMLTGQRDPMARLRRGLRPPPNPAAFWQSIAGFAYIALGVPFTL